VIFIATSVDHLGEETFVEPAGGGGCFFGKAKPVRVPPLATGAFSEEISGPYWVFKDSGCEVTLASVAGGKIPIDPKSQSEAYKTANDRRFLMDPVCMAGLDDSVPLDNADLLDYDIIFLPGGHGTCIDFPGALGRPISECHVHKRVIAAVCHGQCGLVEAVDAKGKPLVAGKKVCAFTNEEEQLVGLQDKVPFLLETRLKQLGCEFIAGVPFQENVVVDGNLVTGQNPKSSVKCAQEALAVYKRNQQNGCLIM